MTHVGEFTIRIEFSDGSIRDVDLSDELHGQVFEPLRDPDVFAQVKASWFAPRKVKCRPSR